MTQIKFGTDGWRAVMGEDYTPENVVKVIQAFCDVEKDSANKLVYVGYDRRKNSDGFAKLVATVLAANGFSPRLATQFCPTPCVSWLVKTDKALAGVMVTASHNPPQWNGIKFKESYGGAASPEYTGRIEKRIVENGAQASRAYPEYETLVASGKIATFDPKTTYVRHMQNFIDVAAIREAGFKIAFDPLFGAGTDFVGNVLGAPVLQIHGEADPNFGGLNPEPIEKNLKALQECVLKNKADVGIATDGDADRIGAVDENGAYINSHQLFALLLRHHLTHRKLKGAVVKSVSATQWIDRICAKFGLPLIETAIGFKYISQELLKNDALMGGEESGGLSLREHVHERDGVLNGLFLLEMMAVHGKKPSQLLQDLYDEFGHFAFHRDDYHLTDAKVAEVRTELGKMDVTEVGGKMLVRYNTLDGTKMFFADDSWLLVRASGTEPLLRVYAEAPTRERVNELLGFAKTRFKLS